MVDGLSTDIDAVAAITIDELTPDEARYAEAARAPSTLRGYRSDWQDWTTWCAAHAHEPMPASAAAVTGYLTALATSGAAVGTMSRRLSALRFAHQMKGRPDPTKAARVVAVWEGIRRTHGAPPEQSAALMPPDLFTVLDACPQVWTPKNAAPAPHLGGLRDRALLLVGFMGALRRSELCGAKFEDVVDHPRGAVLKLPRSKTNQRGDAPELVVLPSGRDPERSPVRALQEWTAAAGIAEGPLFRSVSKANRASERGLSAASVNDVLRRALLRAGIDPAPYSAHSLRAGFVTYAHLQGSSDRAIAHQTRHRSLATLDRYVRIEEAWDDNAATALPF